MIRTQLIKESSKAIAVILDIKEYERLKAIEQDAKDYDSAIAVKLNNENWINHEDLKNKLNIS